MLAACLGLFLIRKFGITGGYHRYFSHRSFKTSRWFQFVLAFLGGMSAQKGALSRRIGRTKGGLNSKLHAVCDADGKPLILLLTEGQVSDYKGAATMLPALPPANALLGDRGYDSDPFRQALQAMGIEPCIPGRNNRLQPVVYDTVLYRQRNRIERMFGRLKDWRRIAMRYDRCAHTFMSAICIAATVLFWL